MTPLDLEIIRLVAKIDRIEDPPHFMHFVFLRRAEARLGPCPARLGEKAMSGPPPGEENLTAFYGRLSDATSWDDLTAGL